GRQAGNRIEMSRGIGTDNSIMCHAANLVVKINRMEPEQLQQRHWYWIRRKDGSLAPYVFHQIRRDEEGKLVADFFVGSFLVPFGLNQIEGEASMPKMGKQP